VFVLTVNLFKLFMSSLEFGMLKVLGNCKLSFNNLAIYMANL
jgi:hypothetical protein